MGYLNYTIEKDYLLQNLDNPNFLDCLKKLGYRLKFIINKPLTSEGETVLMLAAQSSSPEVINYLIEAGADINMKGGDGKTALEYALKAGNYENVKLLIQKGAEIPEEALHIASKASRDDEKIVELLISKGFPVNKRLNGFSPIILASYHGNLKIAKLLIENGADVNAKTDYGMTSLHYACENGYFEIAKLLLTNGADVNAKNNDGISPLMLAAKFGHFDIVKLLLENGANVNDEDNEKESPLIKAMKGTFLYPFSGKKGKDEDYLKIIGLLIKHGAILESKKEEDEYDEEYDEYDEYDEEECENGC